MSTTGQVIETNLKKIGMSKTQLADFLGVSVKTVWTWTTNENSPKMSSARKMASLFGITLDELAGDAERTNDRRRDYIDTVYNRLNEAGREYLRMQAEFADAQPGFRAKGNNAMEVTA